MRVLIDERAPKALKAFLTKQGHEPKTVQEAGWAGKQNGELLSLAETKFDVLVTIDANLRYQQNLEGRKIAILILEYSSNRLDHLRRYFPASLKLSIKSNPVRSSSSARPLETSGIRCHLSRGFAPTTLLLRPC